MNEQRDPLLQEIGAMLRVEPGVGFEADVRRRVEASPVRWPRNRQAAAAAVLMVGVGAAAAGWLLRSPALPVSRASVESHRNAPASHLPGGVQSPGPAPSRSTVESASAVREVAARRTARRREPEILVPADQGRLLERLLIDAAEGIVALPAHGPDLDEPVRIHALQPVSALDVELIVVEPLPKVLGS